MAPRRMVLEIGMGTDIRGGDSTKAAVRAVKDALWRNSLGLSRALGMTPDDMRVEVRIGVPNPATVDKEAVKAALPYGRVSVEVLDGGLAIPTEDGKDCTTIAHAAAVVFLEVPARA